MQFEKEFTLSGSLKNITLTEKAILVLACFGACLTFLGLYKTPSLAPIYFVAGSSLLLIAAIYYKLIYFIALEMILISGHAAVLFDLGLKLQLALPIMLSLQLLLFYYLSGQLTNFFIILGILGIAFLSIGFAYQNQLVFLSGSCSTAIYAYYAARTIRPAVIWGILNTLFSIFAVYKLVS